MPFLDLLAANAAYADNFEDHKFDGKAHAGVCLLTCMDSRIEPLAMVGLKIGDAKILRTPGGHLTPDALLGCVLAVHCLNVDRIMVISHTRCAMANSNSVLRERVAAASGLAKVELDFGADPDRLGRLAADVQTLARHDLVGPFAEVAGFDYDVDSGRLSQIC